MRTVLFFLTILLQTGACFAFLPLIGTKDVNSPENSTVILISMDGFRADYWDKVETPRFHELMKQGVLASNLQPVFPSVTFVNHYSIVTGLYAENHGIVNNSMWDPKTDRKFEISDTKEVNRSDWWQGEPIWVTAEKQGLKTASMFWVGSSAEIGGYRPSYWFNYDASLPRAKRVKQVLDWLDYPQDKRPGFITLYFEDVDEAGHSYGPDSGQVKLAIQNLDSSLGELWDGIKTRGLQEKVTILIVSDHGMAKVDRKNRIRLNDYVKKSEAKVVGKGALSLVWPNSQSDLETILSRVKKTVGPFIVLQKDKMPKEFHYSNHHRIPPLVFSANLGWYIDTGLLPSLKPETFGLHGYNNSLPEMQAVFLAIGPRFPKDRKVGQVVNVDIYSLLAEIMKIRPAYNDGNLSRIASVVGLQNP